MASVSNEQNLLKHLLTAVSIAKEIVHLSYKIDENQAILSEMRSYYDAINGN
jgi:hypothetical protein